MNHQWSVWPAQMPGSARRRCVFATALICAVVLSGCATPIGGVVVTTPSSALASPDAPATSGPTSSPSPTVTPSSTVIPLPDPVPSASGSASVTIVNWNADGQVLSASGLVTGARDKGGKCTLIATSPSGQLLTGEIAAQSTPAAINCGLIDISAPAGRWQLVLTYTDGDETQSSEPVSVDQP